MTEDETPIKQKITNQERDLLQRSVKKVWKDEKRFFDTTALVPRVEEWMQENEEEVGNKTDTDMGSGKNEGEDYNRTYADMVTGGTEEENRNRTYANIMTGEALESDDETLDSKEEEKHEKAVSEIGNMDNETEEQKKENNKADIIVEDIGQGLFNIVINEEANREL
ncbi:hypothetical protein AHAS_Ahas17G0288200 [Arachis hypogaea]